ncbi:MAG: helix-turn-helix transcriptional regulator [Sphingomonadales bacterium]|nr:helix-turn-helix transcriptional regulator [Sphingomonadales bacterium]
MSNLSEQPCLIARSLALVGDAWSMLILRDAHAGLTRFDEFRKSLGIAPTILTRRLAMLTQEGLLEKRRYSERPPRDEYILSESGSDFLPVLFAIGAWGRKHRNGDHVTRFFVPLEEVRDQLQLRAIVTLAQFRQRRVRHAEAATRVRYRILD